MVGIRPILSGLLSDPEIPSSWPRNHPMTGKSGKKIMTLKIISSILGLKKENDKEVLYSGS